MSQLPMAAVITPLGMGHPQNPALPVLSYAEGPPRCVRCRAYFNPFVRTGSDRGVVYCNFCSGRNVVPFAVDSVSALLRERPELQ
jgi:protein transport protein SEC24